MEPTLLILAAGMASRYGSMKQIQAFGPSGETIMDYSIYDAMRPRYKKVVFIVRENFADDVKAIFEPKLKEKLRRISVPGVEFITDGQALRQANPGHGTPLLREIREPF